MNHYSFDFNTLAGGYDETGETLDSVEFLNPFESTPKKSISEWTFGPKLPFELRDSTMVSSPSGKGVVLIGGWNRTTNEYSDAIIEFECSSMKWNVLEQKLQMPRKSHVAIPIPNKLNWLKDDKRRGRKRIHVYRDVLGSLMDNPSFI